MYQNNETELQMKFIENDVNIFQVIKNMEVWNILSRTRFSRTSNDEYVDVQ